MLSRLAFKTNGTPVTAVIGFSTLGASIPIVFGLISPSMTFAAFPTPGLYTAKRPVRIFRFPRVMVDLGQLSVNFRVVECLGLQSEGRIGNTQPRFRQNRICRRSTKEPPRMRAYMLIFRLDLCCPPYHLPHRGIYYGDRTYLGNSPLFAPLSNPSIKPTSVSVPANFAK